jgi:peptidoglycan/LPS O-acetylase OafA/YrhL
LKSHLVALAHAALIALNAPIHPIAYSVKQRKAVPTRWRSLVMRTSDGKYYPGLDHMRALAAFLVFGWHFTHGFHGLPAAFGPGLTPVLAPFNEGHCVVALFMCLSGYLFAKILDGKQVYWRAFYWNRFLRLAPLLIVVCAIRGALIAQYHPEGVESYAKSLVMGLIEPTWPNGGWSITVEIHFYLLLWIIIPLTRRWLPFLFLFLALGLGARILIYFSGGDVAHYAYSTIIGRIDQFILGIAAWEYRSHLKGRHVWIGMLSVAFFGFYQWFVSVGGYYATQGTQAVWIFVPTVEATFFSFLVVYYDTTFVFSRTWYWRLIEVIGATSYSIYLLHTFVVFDLANKVDGFLPGMATWEVAEAVALATFVIIVPAAWLSYRSVEMPFLQFRTKYTQ